MIDNSWSNIDLLQTYMPYNKKGTYCSAISLIKKRNSKHAIDEKTSKYPRG